MATIHLPPDFKEFLRLLNAHQVRYLLVGGYAVGYYGYPRATADMDIWVESTSENAQRILRALSEFGFTNREMSAEVFQKENQIIRMGFPPLRIEIITTASGVHFEICYAERAIWAIEGIEVSLVSLNHLKANKKACGRHKDLDDLEHLP